MSRSGTGPRRTSPESTPSVLTGRPHSFYKVRGDPGSPVVTGLEGPQSRVLPHVNRGPLDGHSRSRVRRSPDSTSGKPRWDRDGPETLGYGVCRTENSGRVVAPTGTAGDPTVDPDTSSYFWVLIPLGWRKGLERWVWSGSVGEGLRDRVGRRSYSSASPEVPKEDDGPRSDLGNRLKVPGYPVGEDRHPAQGVTGGPILPEGSGNVWVKGEVFTERREFPGVSPLSSLERLSQQYS